MKRHDVPCYICAGDASNGVRLACNAPICFDCISHWNIRVFG